MWYIGCCGRFAFVGLFLLLEESFGIKVSHLLMFVAVVSQALFFQVVVLFGLFFISSYEPVNVILPSLRRSSYLPLCFH